MCRVDLHVHTRRYSGCAEFLDPWDLGAAMSNSGIDGVVLTEHDAWWSDGELGTLRKRCHPRRLYRGIELTACDGHVVALGVTGALPIDKSRSVAMTAKAVASLGGFCILVHPLRSRQDWQRTAPAGIGAVEIASTVTVGDTIEASRALALSWGLPTVAGSDAHALDRVGYCYTRFPVCPESEVELCRLLRAGAGLPERDGRRV